MVAAAAMHAGLCCEDGSGGCGGDGGERGGVAVQPTVAVAPGTYESHRVLHRGTVRFSVPWYTAGGVADRHRTVADPLAAAAAYAAFENDL